MEIAKNLIEEGMSYEQIAKVIGLPLEEIQKLAGNEIA
jgi:DNA-directed RNA polymerase specialized sigma24 family protein